MVNVRKDTLSNIVEMVEPFQRQSFFFFFNHLHKNLAFFPKYKIM